MTKPIHSLQKMRLLAKVPDNQVDEFMPITELKETLMSVDSDENVFDDEEPTLRRASASQRLADNNELEENVESGNDWSAKSSSAAEAESEMQEEAENNSIPVQDLNWEASMHPI